MSSNPNVPGGKPDTTPPGRVGPGGDKIKGNFFMIDQRQFAENAIGLLTDGNGNIDPNDLDANIESFRADTGDANFVVVQVLEVHERRMKMTVTKARKE